MSTVITHPRFRRSKEDGHERRLARRVARMLSEARVLLGPEAPSPADVRGSSDAAVDSLASVTHVALDQLEEDRGERASELRDLVKSAADLHEQVVRHQLKEREQLHREVEEGLARLSRIASSTQLVDQVCVELVRSCGFTRVMLSRVEGATWLPWKLHFEDDPEGELEFHEWIKGREIPLYHEALAEPESVVVLDAASGPSAHMSLTEASGSTSYVLAPICPAGRLIGYLHGDRFPNGQVDLVDGDLIWAFAEGFGRIYERTVLMERLRAQGLHIQATLDLAETVANRLASTEIALGRSPEAEDDVVREPGDVVIEAPRGNPAIDEELTSREREVLKMMVMGHANSVIAERLVIKEGTVKSHVKHILRKIGAANRVEAISRYLEVDGTR